MPTAVRPFEPEDIPRVAELRRRVFRHSRRTGPGELERYFHQIYFGLPWHDPALPSWVADEDGAVTGFLGIVPLPLVHCGRSLRGAVATQVMVASERRGVVGRPLLERAFAGGHDLLFADVPTVALRKAWQRAGGSAALFYGFSWTRPLRPARHAASLLGSATLVRGARLMARPLLGVIDSVAVPAGVRQPPACTLEPLTDLSVIVDTLPRLAPPGAIRPAYDLPRLEWLLAHAEAHWSDHRIERQVVRAEDGSVAGWFLFLDGGGGTAQVLQAHAAPGRHGDVLRHLFRRAHRAGAMAVRGRLDPAFLDELQTAGCRWERTWPGMLFHAHDPELLAAALRGDALLSGLDGEWWVDF